MREHIYFVYMLASKEQGTLYTGVTNDVLRRVQEHREGLASGFTKRYGVKRLVWVVNLFYSVVVFWNCFLLLLFWMKGH